MNDKNPCPDPRVKGWPLMGSAVPVLTILSMYLYFVKVWGPRMMKDRPPFQIEKLIIGYNVIMVLLSGFFFFVAGSLTYLPGGSYSLVCEPVDYSEREPGTTILWLGWWFLLLKLVELLDTVFFVLRKKFTHISILHVTHHSLVAWGVWIGLKFGGGGHSSFFPIINCGVHMIMYSYYCLAALGPRVRPFLWWKKYLTIVQMVSLPDLCIVYSNDFILMPSDAVRGGSGARVSAAGRGLRVPAVLCLHSDGSRTPLLDHVLQLLPQELQQETRQQQLPASHPLDSHSLSPARLSPTSHSLTTGI